MHDCFSVMTKIQEKVALVMSSPVYFLRELSAASVVALTALSDTDIYVQKQLAKIQEHADQKQRYNIIHGIALCLEKILASRGVRYVLEQDCSNLHTEMNKNLLK